MISEFYPGRTFSAKVDEILGMNAAGQMVATGVVQDATAIVRLNQPYGVILKLDSADIDPNELPGGAVAPRPFTPKA